MEICIESFYLPPALEQVVEVEYGLFKRVLDFGAFEVKRSIFLLISAILIPVSLEFDDHGDTR